jgi:hypothetical protein
MPTWTWSTSTGSPSSQPPSLNHPFQSMPVSKSRGSEWDCVGSRACPHKLSCSTWSGRDEDSQPNFWRAGCAGPGTRSEGGSCLPTPSPWLSSISRPAPAPAIPPCSTSGGWSCQTSWGTGQSLLESMNCCASDHHAQVWVMVLETLGHILDVPEPDLPG